MKEFNIKIFNDKLKKQNIYLIIWVIVIGIAVGFAILGVYERKKEVKLTHLNELITKEEHKTLKNAYVEVFYEPVVFAEYENESTKFYIIQDDEYMYIAYLTEEIYNSLTEKNLNEEPVTIEGYTEAIPEDVKKIAIEAYNEALEQEVISEENFESYFGDIYLNTTKTYDDSKLCFIVAIIIGLLGLVALYTVGSKNKKSKMTLNKMNLTDLKKVEKELANDIKNYKKEQLYLTKTYIISTSSYINIIKYKDIVWLYKEEYRTNILKTSQSIVVVTKDGIKHTIFNVNYSRKSKERFEEVFTELSNKMPKALVGFTNENKLKAEKIYNKKKN